MTHTTAIAIDLHIDILIMMMFEPWREPQLNFKSRAVTVPLMSHDQAVYSITLYRSCEGGTRLDNVTINNFQDPR